MNREQALGLLHKHMSNANLRRHCYAVEATMRALAKRLEKNASAELVEAWGIAGLLHDADYEITKEDDPKVNHTKHILEWIKETDASQDIYDTIASHAWEYVDGAPEPKTKMQWSLYCCDELTGLIVAVALVKPDKRLASVSIKSIMKKWKQKSFAAGVDRNQIEMCKSRLDIPLEEFVGIALTAMQGISNELGL